MLILQLRNIQRLFQHATAGRKQQQIVVDQRRGQRNRSPALQSPTATDQTHAAVAAHLQVGPGQAAGLPEALQKEPGAIAAATGKSQDPAGIGSRPVGIQQGETDIRTEPGRQLGVVIEACQSEDALTPAPRSVSRLAPL